jgi:hypothetical protein
VFPHPGIPLPPLTSSVILKINTQTVNHINPHKSSGNLTLLNNLAILLVGDHPISKG